MQNAPPWHVFVAAALGTHKRAAAALMPKDSSELRGPKSQSRPNVAGGCCWDRQGKAMAPARAHRCAQPWQHRAGVHPSA